MNSLKKNWFWWGVVLLLAIRLWHLGSIIDAPHDWRQCDTAYYIWDFYQNGIDLLHPAVCWMGAKDTLVLEFPLPEALVAASYQIFGPSIPLARCLFLLFFVLGVYYFYRIIALLFGSLMAKVATLIYLAAPLSIFYSRAIHIDFSAIFFAHAMFYYFLIGVAQKRSVYLLISSLAAALAVVIKVPYVFYLALPMAYFIWQEKAFRWTLSRALVYVLPLIAFYAWQQHVYAINSAAPDWDYILHYRKMVQSNSWYFGSLSQRISLYSWWILLQRGVLEVVGCGAILFWLWGFFRIRQLENYQLLLTWLLGVGVYVLIFFNLNFVHNYYQIPLIAPAAVLSAWGMLQLNKGLGKGLAWSMIIVCSLHFFYTEKSYYKIANEEVEIGQLIAQHTPRAALPIVTSDRYDCRNPKLLYRARRRGWSIEEQAINATVIQKLWKEEGADYWIYIGEESPLKTKDLGRLALPSPEVFSLQSIPQKMFIFKLPE